jgi:hypothetical protein
MAESEKFKKEKVRRSRYFYVWVLVLFFAGIWGIDAIVTGELAGSKGSIALDGKAAIIAGAFIVLSSCFGLYILLAKVQQTEIANKEFHKLESFEEQISGYATKFEIMPTCMLYGKAPQPGFYYVLEICQPNKIPFALHMRQRDKVEKFFWKIGLTRFLGIRTNNASFDSKYRVSCADKESFKRLFSTDVMGLLEEFDRDYPPIRARHGSLEIDQEKIRYVEGPYIEFKKLTDPHRGSIKKIFNKLIKIMDKIQSGM